MRDDPSLTSYARETCPELDRQWSDLWLPAPHHIDYGSSAALSLVQLGRILADGDLVMLLPHFKGRWARKRLLEFIGGRLCAERALSSLTGLTVPIPRGLMGEPVWPTALSGSISHTDAAAYALVARRHSGYGVGIDSQQVMSVEDAISVASFCCTIQERRIVLAATDPLAATMIFSAKEALYKALYYRVRRIIDFVEFETVKLDKLRGTISLRPTSDAIGWDWLDTVDVEIVLEKRESCTVHATTRAIHVRQPVNEWDRV